MSNDAGVIAEQLQAAVESGEFLSGSTLSALYADKVEIHHHPEIASDGIISRADLDAGRKAESAVFEQLGARLLLDGPVTVEGDQVILNLVFAAELPDGPCRVPVRMNYTVAEGKIVRLDEDIDAEAAAKLAAIFTPQDAT
jgi:hypothetical protein